jgi:hypothetical protein
MKAEIYVLGLFSFKGEEEENIVFNSSQLDTINSNIEKILELNRVNQDESKWVTYNIETHTKSLVNTASCHVAEATMGYYHHRVIFRFIIEGEKLNSELRDIRESIKRNTVDMINRAIIEPNKDLGFIDCETYPLFILKEGLHFYFKKEDPVFSNDTTTMAFDITEPIKFWPIGRKYNIRISIPSTIIYTRSGVSNDFLKAIINSIYQYCLYEKKELNRQKKINGISEDQLVHLWKHIIDTMGGRTLDKNIAKISETNYILAFAAFIIAIVAFDRVKFLENWGLITGFIKKIFTFLT